MKSVEEFDPETVTFYVICKPPEKSLKQNLQPEVKSGKFPALKIVSTNSPHDTAAASSKNSGLEIMEGLKFISC